MKIASWNVNSLKVRLPHVLEWLEQEQPDALGLQELKMEEHAFPHDVFLNAGYTAYVWGQKTYNGVAWLVKNTLTSSISDHSHGFPNWPDSQARTLTVHFNQTDLIVWYVPNGQAVDSEKYHYKLAWLNAAHDYTQERIAAKRNLIIVGDFNIAPTDADVYNPIAWGEAILCSPAERKALLDLQKLGLHDAFRHFPEHPPKSYTWWDYRQGGFQRNHGLRIDHILVSDKLISGLQRCWIDSTPRAWERPSDHAPILIELDSI